MRQANKNYASLHRTMSTIKPTEGNPSRSDSLHKREGVQSVFHEALVSVQPFPAEDLTETAVKAWKDVRFLTEL